VEVWVGLGAMEVGVLGRHYQEEVRKGVDCCEGDGWYATALERETMCHL